MNWLAWRQFRAQALIALGVLVVFALYLLYIGYTVRRAYNTDVLGCLAADGCDRSVAESKFLDDHAVLVGVPSILLLVLPGIVGVFWGAPLVAREYDNGTQRLVWNQSVTRRRWLAVKLGMIGLFALALTGVLSLLMTWAASRFDQVWGMRFGAVSFASRDVVPLGYTAFALVLGTTVGLVLRRTVAAMAVTLVVLAAMLFVVPLAVRPHLQTPVTESVPLDSTLRERAHGLGIRRNGPIEIVDYTVPGALMLTSTTNLRDASGAEVKSTDVQDCLNQTTLGDGGPDKLEQCLTSHHLHIDITYQPANRYWPFQWIELSGYLVLATLLAGLMHWRIRHVRG
jgi:ABC-type transport system involved in multi-copper enzyme maturation permease subunit